MLIAVYGTLRKGFWNHSLIEKSRFIGAAKTEPDWTMLITGGEFPVLIPGKTSITIEVYDISRETMNYVDALEGYPVWYNRKLIKTPYGDAWIYFMKEYPYSKTTVLSGDYQDYFNEISYHA
jgi:gamma-glutamylaminecyclotransferase